jgi:hypothetical protein
MMPMRWMRRMAWSAPIVMLACTLTEVDAQRARRGRAAGGGLSRSGPASSGTFGATRSGAGGFSSSGIASSGTWQADRASMQANRQASAGQLQSTGQAGAAERQSSRQAQQANL